MSGRIRGVFIALAVLVAGAGIGTWLLTAVDPPKPFSSFAPTSDDPVQRAQEIADFVGGRYTDANGQPLARVDAGEDDRPVLPGAAQSLAVGTNPTGLFSFEYGNILFYRICAAGPTCGLADGQDPTALTPVVGRMAHELALYGLQYVTEAQFVVVILPNGFLGNVPDPSNPPRAVQFFRRADMEDELDRPIAETLPVDVLTPSAVTAELANAVEERVATTRYTIESGTDAANATNVYTLTPLF